MRRLCFLLSATLLLLSCRNPLHEIDPDVSTVRIRPSIPGSDGGRTVTADFSTQFDTLIVSLSSVEGYTAPAAQTVSRTTTQVTFSVRPGHWNITVVAMRGTDEVGRGVKENVSLGSGLTSPVAVPIVFSPVGSTGSVSFVVSVTPGISDIDFVHGRLIESPFTEVDVPLTAAAGKRTGTLAFSGLPSRTYSLEMTFKRGDSIGTVAGIFREKLVVTAGFTSGKWVNADGNLVDERAFGEDEFLGGNASLSALTFNSGLLAFTFNSSATQPFDLGAVAGLPNSLTFTATGSIADQYLRYSWHGSSPLTEIRSGVASDPLVVSGSNELIVSVTAPDRVTDNPYRVTFVAVPPEVSGLSATTSPNSVALTWTNPTVGYFSEAQITYREEGSGVVLDTITLPLSPGGSGSHTITGLSSLQPYVFTVRTGASISHYSSGTSYWACPGGPTQTDFAVDASGTITKYSGSATDVVIPAVIGGVATKSIAGNAFYGSSITSVSIPEGVTTIGYDAFGECSLLTNVTIPTSVTSIAENGFENCRSLVTITLPPGLTTISKNLFYDDIKLSAIVIPDAVELVDNYAFIACRSLTSVVFGSSVTHLGDYLFSSDGNLSTLTFKNPTPPTLGENVFNLVYLSKIYVPAASLQKYKDAPGLQGYASIMEGK